VRGVGPAGGRTGVETQLWRAVVAFRIAALAYAAALLIRGRDDFAHPDAALAALAGMVGWTVLMTVANSRDRGRVWPVVIADHAVCIGLTLASVGIQGREQVEAGVPTLTTSWAASPVLGSAVLGGRVGGAAGALAQGAASVVTRGELTTATVGNLVLLLLAGTVGGYVVRLAVDAERRLAEAVRLEAATRERERLARGIHDGVLQVLALVQRRGAEIGGEAAELVRLAGEQEVALRGLITAPPTTIPRSRPAAGAAGAVDAAAAAGEPVDLRALLAAERSGTVTVSAPAEPVLLPAGVATELAAAVRAALDNVARHAGPGARAWVLVEDLGAEVVVSVRDDGAGMPPGRLEQAAAEGRLGVAASVRGRIAELGGTMSVVSAPGEGTEVELRLPRREGGWSG
jgi:signal transduction histidine kinase